MDRLSEFNMNFSALKRVDPYAKRLLATSTHVALYTFIENEWEKTEVEGSLFVYSRTGEPFHNIIIMNRLNMKNLVEPVTQGLDLQLQDPFLLYRTAKGSIFGIWFYDKDECVTIANILSRIINGSSEYKLDKKETPIMEACKHNVDIFSMLTKAQEEFNSKSPQKNQLEVFGAPLDMNFNFKDIDQTPQSVMDFFAKASNGSKFIQDSSFIHSPGMFINNARSCPPPALTRMPAIPITLPPSQSEVKPLLQRLMSNPAHRVEHIEKQQRANTPQSDFVGMIKNGNSVLSTSNNSDERNGLGYIIKPSTSLIGSDVRTVCNAVFPQNNSVGFLRISDSPPRTSTVHSQQYYNSKLIPKHSPLMENGPLQSNTENYRPLSAPIETHLKPALLMPPVMFTSSLRKEDNSDTTSTSTPNVIVNSALGVNSLNHPEPLTKNQLLQAVHYLLKHDSDFINKLHEAYVKSFTELVS